MHISGAFKGTEKPDIERVKPDIQDGKADIEVLKADIDNRFTAKTTEHILKLCEKFQVQTIFGRSDVMRMLDMKASRASELLKEMAEQGIIEPVSGFGKWKYRFRRSRTAAT